MGNPLNALSEFAESLWSKCIKFKVSGELTNAVFWFKAQVVENLGNGYLKVQKPFDSVVTVRCVPALRRSTAGSQVTVLSFGKGNAANCVAIGNGSMDNQTVIADSVYIGDHDSPIGTVRTETGASAGLASGTSWREKCSITLAPGTWLIVGSASFAGNSSGWRGVALSTNSGGPSDVNARRTMNSGGSANIYMETTYPISFTDVRTYYLNVYQNSGAELTCEGRIRATRLA